MDNALIVRVGLFKGKECQHLTRNKGKSFY